MISYLKKLLKQNDSVKIHLIDGSVVSALHFKKGYSNGNCLVIDEDNTSKSNLKLKNSLEEFFFSLIDCDELWYNINWLIQNIGRLNNFKN